jgi:hypothetical protein
LDQKYRRDAKSVRDFFVKIGSRFSFQNRSAIFIFKPDPDFQIIIAITIAIKNRSGKIKDRFLFCGYFCSAEIISKTLTLSGAPLALCPHRCGTAKVLLHLLGPSSLFADKGLPRFAMTSYYL